MHRAPFRRSLRSPFVAFCLLASGLTGALLGVGSTAAQAAPQVNSCQYTTRTESTPCDLTYAQLEGLWIAAGGDASAASTAAAIAEAESYGGDPGAIQPYEDYCGALQDRTGWGLFQITCGNSQPQAGIDYQLLDPWNNTEAAVQIYDNNPNGHHTFLRLWSTYGDGSCPGNLYCSKLQSSPPQPYPILDPGEFSPVNSGPIPPANNTSCPGCTYGTAMAQPGAVPVDLVGTNQEDVFAVAANGTMWESIGIGGSYGNWFQVNIPGGDKYATAVTVVSPGPNQLEIFGTGANNYQVFEAIYNPTPCNCWSSETDLGGYSNYAPAAVALQGTSEVDLFAVGSNSALWQSYSVNGSTFSGWFQDQVPGPVNYQSGLAAVSPATGQEDVFGDSSRQVFVTSNTGTGWTAETDLGGFTLFAPTAETIQGTRQTNVFATGSNFAAWESLSIGGGPLGSWFQATIPGGDSYIGGPSSLSPNANQVDLYGTGINGADYVDFYNFPTQCNCWSSENWIQGYNY